MSDIKMSEVFPKGIEPRGLFVHPSQINKNYDDGVTPHTYICHAVEAHDTLVAQNLALKAALEKVKAEQELERSEAGHSGYSETWLISSNALVALEGVGDE